MIGMGWLVQDEVSIENAEGGGGQGNSEDRGTRVFYFGGLEMEMRMRMRM